MWYADRWLYSTFNESCEHSLEQVAANALCSVIAPPNRGRLQAQGSNPPLEASVSWAQDGVPSKGDGLRWLDNLWARLSDSQQRDRHQAYVDAKEFIRNAPQDGYEAYPTRISRTFQDPQRRDPAARIDIEIITGRAFDGPF